MSSITLGSNISALLAQRQLSKTTYAQNKLFDRLSSGQRITQASDDAAGLAVSASLNKDVRVYTQAIRNGNDAISAFSIAEGGLKELNDTLIRLKELAIQSANSPFSRVQRLSLDDESEALTDEFNRLTASVNFNNINLLNGQLGQLTIQLGFGTNGRIGFNLGSALTRKLGTGFNSPQIAVSPISNTGTSASTDINGDGNLDLFSYDTGSSEYYVALGNGDGTFQTQIAANFTLGAPSTIAAGDVTGDGKVDIVASYGGLAFVITGGGDGTFSTERTINTNALTYGNISLADINQDGRLDIVGQSGTTIATLLNQGGGYFGSATSYSSSTNLLSMTLTDINNDGILDIAGRGGTTNISVRLGSSNGSFGSENLTAIGTSASAATFGDFNYDGMIDVALINGTNIGIMNGNNNGTFGTLSNVLSSTSASTIYASDMDGDGILDLQLSTTSAIKIAKGRGNGTFEPATSYSITSSTVLTSLTADFNNDGVNDIIARDGSGQLNLYTASTTNTTSIQRINLTTRAAALESLSFIDNTMNRVSKELGIIGAAQSRIQSSLNTLYTSRENSAAAASRITDADVAQESANQVRLQILQNMGAAILSKTVQSQNLVLELLRP